MRKYSVLPVEMSQELQIKRNPRKVRWTKAYRKLHGKELSQDTSFEFQRRRSRSERYDRIVVEQTIKAIKKIEDVRVKRESKFWESRIKSKKSTERKEAATELKQSIYTVRAPLAVQADPSPTLPKKVPEQIKVKVVTKRQSTRAMQE